MAETVHLDLKVIFRRLNQMRLLSSSKILWLSQRRIRSCCIFGLEARVSPMVKDAAPNPPFHILPTWS